VQEVQISEDGNLDVCFEVEIKDFKNKTISEMESSAVSKASNLLLLSELM
jgi:hypothetical protein